MVKKQRVPKPVYRLENKAGHGPYSGEQKCINWLRPHADPHHLLKLCGYPKQVLDVLSKAGFVFGWGTRKDYNSFFKRGGQQNCRTLGFDLVIYKPELRFILPDGQVMFAKSADEVVVTEALKELLDILSKKNQ